MKTRKIVKTEAKSDFEAICEAKNLLMNMIITQPYCKHTVTVELSNGKTFQMWASPRLERKHTA